MISGPYGALFFMRHLLVLGLHPEGLQVGVMEALGWIGRDFQMAGIVASLMLSQDMPSVNCCYKCWTRNGVSDVIDCL